LTGLLLDTHVVLWWSSQRERVSDTAQRAISEAGELLVASITWWELAWLARQERITVHVPVSVWLGRLAAQVRTIGITPNIALAAASLPSAFPGDPTDRLIYATAIEHGLAIVTKDQRMRAHKHPRKITIW
jgi:PIN domain nuclease of toxin-antitoxin system